jgi:hypothetical protein
MCKFVNSKQGISIMLISVLMLFSYTTATAQKVINFKVACKAKGNGLANDTEAFRALGRLLAQSTTPIKVIIPKGTYIVGDQKQMNGIFADMDPVLLIKNCKNVAITGFGAKIKYQSGLFYGAFDPVSRQPHYSNQALFQNGKYLARVGNCIRIESSEKVQLEGLTLDGNSDEAVIGGKYGDDQIQVPYTGIMIVNSRSISVVSCTVNNMGLDGIHVANETPQGESTSNQNIVITNSKFLRNGRQGMSWVGGVGLTCSKCVFSQTGRGVVQTNPGAGLDIEAEVGIVQQGRFTGCTFADNRGCGVVAETGSSKDMIFTNCKMIGTTNWALWIRKPKYRFDNCKFYGGVVHGYGVSDDVATQYEKCYFSDSLSLTTYGDALVTIEGTTHQKFNNCTFNSQAGKKLFYFRSASDNQNNMPTISNSLFKLNSARFTEKNAYYAMFVGVNLSNNTFGLTGPSMENGNIWSLWSVANKETNKFLVNYKK